MEDNFESLVDAFLDFMRNNKSSSENTITNYAVDLAQYADYMENQGLSPTQATAKTIRAYLRSLSGYGYANTSISRKLSAIKTFELYLLGSRVISSDPAASVRSPRTPERLPRAVSSEAMERLIEEAWKIKPQLRSGTILEILYGCGVRVAELVSLRWQDADLEERWLKVRGKGDKERLVPFGRAAKEALLKWREVCPPDAEYIFQSGKKPLTVRTVHRLVVKAAQNAGLENVTPHSVRHSFATHMLEGGASLNVLQELLGHESLLTTQRYLKITPSHLRESYLAAHPRSGEET